MGVPLESETSNPKEEEKTEAGRNKQKEEEEEEASPWLTRVKRVYQLINQSASQAVKYLDEAHPSFKFKSKPLAAVKSLGQPNRQKEIEITLQPCYEVI